MAEVKNWLAWSTMGRNARGKGGAKRGDAGVVKTERRVLEFMEKRGKWSEKIALGKRYIYTGF